MSQQFDKGVFYKVEVMLENDTTWAIQSENVYHVCIVDVGLMWMSVCSGNVLSRRNVQ